MQDLHLKSRCSVIPSAKAQVSGQLLGPATISKRPTVLRFASIPPETPNVIVPRRGIRSLLGTRFDKFPKKYGVLDSLRDSYAKLFDGQAEAVMPMPPAGNEMEDRLRSVAENGVPISRRCASKLLSGINGWSRQRVDWKMNMRR